MTKKKKTTKSNWLWKNKTFSLIFIPIVVGLSTMIIWRLLSPDESKDKIEYNIESNNQSGGVVAGHIDNLNVDIESKDEILAEKYYTSLNLFIAKYRMILYSYYLEYDKQIPMEVDTIFKVSKFPIKNSGGVSIKSINKDIINQIFNYYDFNSQTGMRFIDDKPTLRLENKLHFEFYLPNNLDIRNGDIITGYVWLIGELKDLQKSCNDILSRYASVGDSKLVDDIERLNNDIENIVKKHRYERLPYFDHRDIQIIQSFFDRFSKSYFFCQDYRAIPNT
jgi:hypothetical protein